MFCMYCGEKLEDYALFCPKCGKSLENNHQPKENEFSGNESKDVEQHHNTEELSDDYAESEIKVQDTESSSTPANIQKQEINTPIAASKKSSKPAKKKKLRKMVTIFAVFVLISIGIRLLLDYIYVKTADMGLIEAVITNDASIVREYIRDGTNANWEVRDYGQVIDEYLPYKGWSILSIAVENNSVDVVKLLLKKGARIEDKDLYNAVKSDFADVAKLLIKAGANVNANADSNGWTPLYTAAEYNSVNVAKVLIDAGANVNLRRPLMPASRNGYVEMVKLLIDAGANANAGLLAAAAFNSVTVAKVLIDAGADVDALDNEGKAALTVAEQEGHREIERLLRKAGAKYQW